MNRREFEDVFEKVKTWGTYPDPSAGAWQTVTAASVTEAASLVRSGRVVTTALPWNTVSGPSNANPALHYMTDLGVREAPEPSCNKDFIGVDYHGKAVSHLDALSHIAYKGMLYEGQASRDVVTATGADFGSVSSLGPLVAPAVLLDFTVLFDVPWLEPGTAIHAEDILAAEARLGVQINQGDAVLIRTGHFRRARELGAWDSSDLSAGLHVDCMPLLAERGISVLGGDGDSDVRPSPTPGIHSPVHILAITAMGLPLLDNLDLEALGAACAEEDRYRFMLVVAPLNIPRGTGSPVNPLAVF
ncbi:cyclase family protein [Arthrobacter sp. GN70]|nr:cyclase family protein [Arthrobacter sp. GN70]